MSSLADWKVKPHSILFLLLMIGWISFGALVFLWYTIGTRALRYIECNPGPLFSEMEIMLEIDLPDYEDLIEVKAAKTRPLGGPMNFVVKFSATPDIVEKFIASLPPQTKFEEYLHEFDVSRIIGERDSVLPWLAKRILSNKAANIWVSKSMRGYPSIADIYFDTSDEKQYVVYLYGVYDKSYVERQKQQTVISPR